MFSEPCQGKTAESGRWGRTGPGGAFSVGVEVRDFTLRLGTSGWSPFIWLPPTTAPNGTLTLKKSLFLVKSIQKLMFQFPQFQELIKMVSNLCFTLNLCSYLQKSTSNVLFSMMLGVTKSCLISVKFI